MINIFKKILYNKYYNKIDAAQKNIEPYLQKSEIFDQLTIALCISGHIRDYKRVIESYRNFKKIVSKYGNVDVFISTWNKQNSANCWSSSHGFSADNSHSIEINKEDIIKHFEATKLEINNYDFYKSIFSPLQYNILTNQSYNWDQRGIHNGILGSTKMFYLIYKANLLKLQQEYINQRQYDWVFRLRPDMEYDIGVCENTIKLDSLDNNKLYVGATGNDQFAFGGSTVMNKYSSAILKTGCVFDSNVFGDPETIHSTVYTNLIGLDNIVHISRCGLLKAEKHNCPIQLR